MKLWSAVIALMTAGLLAAGCRSSPTTAAAAEAAAPKTSAVPVTVVRVSVRPTQRLVNFVGTLYGNEEVTISSQVEGQIRALYVDLGDPIRGGQGIAQIDDDQLRARLREAEATLAKARADAQRGRQLADGRVISAQELESMTTHAAVSEAQRDTLSVMIRHARVNAPITGAVAHRFVSVGEYVHPGSPLFTLVAEDPLKLRGDVPERFAHELHTGQSVQVRVDAFPDRSFDGRLARISPASNPANRSVAVEVAVDNHARALKSGFFANAGVVTRADDRALMVPQEALITFAGVTKLFVIRDGVAEERPVHTGTRGGEGLVEVLDGVGSDELVAVSGVTKLENGTRVTVRETAGAPPAS